MSSKSQRQGTKTMWSARARALAVAILGVLASACAGQGPRAQAFDETRGGVSPFSAGGEEEVFTAVADARVRSSRPHRNYGAKTILRVRDGGTDYRSYLKFEVSGVGDAPLSARVALYVLDGSPDGGTLHRTADSWREDAITWADAPALGSALDAAGRVKAGRWAIFDVAGAVTGDGVFSFALRSGSSNSAYFSSREGSRPPRLLIRRAEPAADSGTPGADAGPAPDTTSAGAAEGIWIGRHELAQRPTSGPAWRALLERADRSCGTPDLSDQNDKTNICVLAKALVYARTDQPRYRDDVRQALASVVGSGSYHGRALALGRELGTYAIAADLIDLPTFDPGLDAALRAKLRSLLTTPTVDGPKNLVECHERRPNNWGTHCGATRAAVAAYLGDKAELDRTAQVFRGWLGDRSAYAGFKFGDLSWQCDPNAPVAINPAGCTRAGHDIDGVLPDDQRRGGAFRWPPPRENYVYEALQGALMQAVILHRAGYPVFAAEGQALRRAFRWLHQQASYPAAGDDTWQPHLVNHFYGASFPAPVPAGRGKAMAFSDWTHGS